MKSTFAYQGRFQASKQIPMAEGDGFGYLTDTKPKRGVIPILRVNAILKKLLQTASVKISIDGDGTRVSFSELFFYCVHCLSTGRSNPSRP